MSETIISTHILTRRMTFHLGKSVQVLEYFNSHPHEEDDKMRILQFRINRHFNSHPHEEDDGGGRKRSEGAGIFQLTSSRGG